MPLRGLYVFRKEKRFIRDRRAGEGSRGKKREKKTGGEERRGEERRGGPY